MTSVLLFCLSLFKRNNITVVPFKGPLLAQHVYGDIGLRPFSDLDLFVKTADVPRAYQLLKENGFNPLQQLKKKQIEKLIHLEDELSFFSKAQRVTIELHWELSGRYLTRPLLFEELERRFTTALLNKQPVLTFSNEDLLVYLCVHGSRHGWEHLELITSIAELIKTKALNWQRVYAISHRWKSRKMLELGLLLALKVVDAPIPELVQPRIFSNRMIMTVAQKAVSCYPYDRYRKPPKYDQSSRFSPFHISIRDSLAEKIRYAIRLLFSPTIKEWMYFPVPASLSSLHWVLRPMRLVWHFWILKHKENGRGLHA